MYQLLQSFVDVNPILSRIRKFVLYPGMEFDSREKWWPDKGFRPTLHEGVDVCYFVNDKGQVSAFTPSILVPAAAEGRIIAFCDDFLGHTVFVEHSHDCYGSLIAAYAHIVPQASLHEGMDVHQGQVLGRVADTSGRKNRMPCHLHFSCMNTSLADLGKKLDWNVICNRSESALLDPLDLIDAWKVTLLPQNPWKEKQLNETS